MSHYIKAAPITLTLQYDANGFTVVSYEPSNALTNLQPGQPMGVQPQISWHVGGPSTATVIFTGPENEEVAFAPNTPASTSITCQEPNYQFQVSYSARIDEDSCEFEPMDGMTGAGPRVILLASTKPVPDDLGD